MTDSPFVTAEPPQIPGVRRSFVEANGVRFHVTESGPADGRPVLALHGWPQHHWEYRDLLADPPPGLRIIAPDLPGYGWSGPAPHKWAKEDVATDVLALMDAMGLDRVVLAAHDWGGYVGYLMVLRAPERFDGFLAMNINHPWQNPRAFLPHLWRLYYQLPIATFGVPLQRHTKIVNFFFRGGSEIDPAEARIFADQFRDPVCARAGRDTYRTFLLHDLPGSARKPEKRRATVPIRVLLGTRDPVVVLPMVSPETAKADDYTLETTDATHFVVDERPDLVRKKLIALAEETAHS
jgi:pimeloyl-ACP methyl ester carboxylesterase